MTVSLRGVPESVTIDDEFEVEIDVRGEGRARLLVFLNTSAAPSVWCLREMPVEAGTYEGRCTAPVEDTTVEAELRWGEAVIARASAPIVVQPRPREPAPELTRVGDAATLVAHVDEEAAQMYWTLEGDATKNPRLVAPAATQITLTVRSASDAPHRFEVDGGPRGAMLVGMGEETTYTFTTPATGSVDYRCVIHPDTMVGRIVVE